VVAGGRATDRPPNQTTGPERQWRKHVLALVAADLSLGGWPIVRRLLRETPYPRRHPIPPESHPTPASFALAKGLGGVSSPRALACLARPAVPQAFPATRSVTCFGLVCSLVGGQNILRREELSLASAGSVGRPPAAMRGSSPRVASRRRALSRSRGFASRRSPVSIPVRSISRVLDCRGAVTFA
jgi:hypothetical protein